MVHRQGERTKSSHTIPFVIAPQVQWISRDSEKMKTKNRARKKSLIIVIEVAVISIITPLISNLRMDKTWENLLNASDTFAIIPMRIPPYTSPQKSTTIETIALNIH